MIMRRKQKSLEYENRQHESRLNQKNYTKPGLTCECELLMNDLNMRPIKEEGLVVVFVFSEFMGRWRAIASSREYGISINKGKIKPPTHIY